jgi:hypothetical protein
MDSNAVAGSAATGLDSRGPGDSQNQPETHLRAEDDIGHAATRPFFTRLDLTDKQDEDPPRNSQGNLICRFQNICPELAFDRKREWR